MKITVNVHRVKRRVRFLRRWTWSGKDAILLGLWTFIFLGPFQLLIHDNAYRGSSIFASNPLGYFILQGVFVAGFVTASMYLIDWLIRRRRSAKVFAGD